MKKSLFFHLSVLAVLIVFVSSCSQSAAYTNVIPANANVVVAINLKSLAQKAGLNEKENKEAFKKLTDALKSGMNAAAYQQLEAVINDPKKSGVDVTSPIYLFNTSVSPTGMLAAKVIDESALSTFLEAMQKELGSTPITKADGYNYTSVEQQTLIGFNASTLLVINYNDASQLEKAKTEMTSLLKQTEEQSISSTPAFKKMQKMGGDIYAMGAPEGLLGEYAQQLNMGASKEMNLKDLIILGSLSFEKGRIEATFENFTDNEELKKMLEQQQKSSCPMENTFLKYFPKATVAFGGMGINGPEFYNVLQINEMFRKEVSLEQAEFFKSLFETLQGDINVGLINVTMNNAPTVLAYANMKSAAPLKTLYDNKAKMKLSGNRDIVKLGEDEYVYKSPETNMFFGVRNKQFYATNDELLYKNLFKAVDPSLKDVGYASEIKGAKGAVVINVEAVLMLPLVQMLMGFAEEEHKTYYAMAQSISYLSFTAKDEKSIVALQLKDKDVNALKQIVNFVKTFAGM